MDDVNEAEVLFLNSSRNGDSQMLVDIIKARDENEIDFNINCKGQLKSNFSWTPLHLASYFGHTACAEVLLKHGADVDALNDYGDTPLHKAALTNRDEIILLLLDHGAKVNIINGEGCKASDLSRNTQSKKLILGAEKGEEKKTEQRLLTASREGCADDVKKLLHELNPPNVNCIDSAGNTSLHCAAYRNHIEVAVLLLQNGCDTNIKNYNGHTALDMVQSQQMQQVLAVPPVKSFYRAAQRFEGPLLKKSRILGWRMIWAVLERGVLTFFRTRADACSGVCRKDYKYLDNAKVVPSIGIDQGVFMMKFNDGSRFSVAAVPDPVHSASLNRQKWVAAIDSHIKFSTHYVRNGFSVEMEGDDDEKVFKPLGCMEDALSTANAHRDLLEQEMKEVSSYYSYVKVEQNAEGSVNTVLKKLNNLMTAARGMSSSLNHCLSLMKQQEEVRELQLLEEREKVRVLEEALRVLATEHHELEESLAIKGSSTSPSLYNTPANSIVSVHKLRFGSSEHDDFYDLLSHDDDADTLHSFPSPSDSICSTNTLVSCMSSLPVDPLSPEDSDSLSDSGGSTPTPPVATSPSYTTASGDFGNDGVNRSNGATFTISTPAHTTSPSGSFTLSLTEGTDELVSPVETMLPAEVPLVRTLELNESESVAGEESESSSSSQSDHYWKRKDVSPASNLVSCEAQDEKRYPKHLHKWRIFNRKCLPAAQFQRNDFSLWSVLRQCIGKELSKITMPVVFNEPLSFLQRVSEFMEYAWLLDKADTETDPAERIQYIAAFAISGLASNWERIGKPFNPLLGETYELQRDQYRIISEQVSHHPPVSAFAADSPRWTFHGSIHPKLKFVGKSFEIQPKGVFTIELPNHGEAYTWSNVNCCVHNIIVGKLWIEQYGTMEITNNATGHKCVLNFKPASWLSKDLHRVEGFVFDKDKEKLVFLYGKWNEFLKSTDIESYTEYMKIYTAKLRHQVSRKSEGGNSSRKVLSKLNSITSSFRMSSDVESDTNDETTAEGEEGNYPRSDSRYSIDIPNSAILWEADPRLENSPEYYHFTMFAMSLNELDDQMRDRLSPTDSRLRPDIRFLEEGEIDRAAAEKTRLEEKQRDARKGRRKDKIEYKSRWFDQGQNPFTGQEDWMYSGGYWDRNFSDISDIF